MVDYGHALEYRDTGDWRRNSASMEGRVDVLDCDPSSKPNQKC